MNGNIFLLIIITLGVSILCFSIVVIFVTLKDINKPLEAKIKKRQRKSASKMTIDLLEKPKEEIPVESNVKLVANRHFYEGRPAEAIVAIKEVLHETPTDLNFRIKLADCYRETGDNENALTEYRKILAEDPTDIAIALKMADILFEKDFYEEAKAHYNKVLAVFPNDTEVLLKLALINLRRGLVDDAKDILNVILSIDPHQEAAKCYVAELYEKDKDYNLAVKHYRELVSRYPKKMSYKSLLSAALCNYGVQKHTENKTQDALDLYLEASKLDPSNGDIFFNLGKTYTEIGDYSNAIFNYEKALKLNPTDPDAFIALAGLIDIAGDTQRALKIYSDAITANPNSFKLRCAYGAALGSSGKIDYAIRELKAALKINPNFDEGHYNLGVAYEAIGEIDNAIEEYEETLRCNANHYEAKSNLEALKSDTELLDEEEENV